MGWNVFSWRMMGSTSAHNDERDDAHEALRDEMIAELEAILEKEKYRDISPTSY